MDFRITGAVNPWVPVVVQIMLGILSIAGTGLLVQLLNFRKERKEFIRDKLEALFEEFSKYQQICSLGMSLWFLAGNRQLSPEVAESRYEKEVQTAPDHFGSVQMLIYLYFPELLPKFRACADIFERGMPSVIRVREVFSVKDPNLSALEKQLPRLAKCVADFPEATEAFKIAISEYGKRTGLLKMLSSTGNRQSESRF